MRGVFGMVPPPGLIYVEIIILYIYIYRYTHIICIIYNISVISIIFYSSLGHLATAAALSQASVVGLHKLRHGLLQQTGPKLVLLRRLSLDQGWWSDLLRKFKVPSTMRVVTSGGIKCWVSINGGTPTPK
jgi:hypothetical protein